MIGSMYYTYLPIYEGALLIVHLRILNDDVCSGVNTSVGSGVEVYGRSAPFSNLDDYEKSQKKHKKASKKHSPKAKMSTSRRTYE